jgi:hypothetical protein
MLPFTFTWTPDHVYVTCSSFGLTTYKFALFKPTDSSLWVSEPKLLVTLPLSCRNRQVHYFPPADKTGHGLVLASAYDGVDPSRVRLKQQQGAIHGESEKSAPYPCPAVGFHVEEDRDLGGWVESSTVTDMPNGFRDGRLNRKMEHFDPEDDCDLEIIART